MTQESPARHATLHRMVMQDHLCPYGLKARSLLERKGFEVDDRWLETREETEAFMRERGVETTPQIYIDGRRIGGYDALRVHLGLDDPDEETTYRPVIALFGVAALMAAAVAVIAGGTGAVRVLELFVAISMTLLGLQKLQDVEGFSTMFLNYDLLARRWVPYGYLYPYLETAAGLMMLAGVLLWAAGPIAFAIGTVGAVSVVKAVYIDRRELRCACVGGGSRVPLGFTSLTENLMMMGMGLWMPLRAYLLAG